MFNKNQIEAISHKEGPAIVLAGPGSGKTTVITHRVKKLIEAGVPPEKILVVTFTNAAAKHMRQRFLDIAGKPEKQRFPGAVQNPEVERSSYPVTFGTFHSIYYRILRLSGDYRGSSILSDREKSDILKEIIIRNRIDVPSLTDFVQSISGELSRVKGNMDIMETYSPKCCTKEIFWLMFNEYEKTLRLEQKIDFEDMLLKCHDLFTQKPDVLKQWQEMYQYILIDEFQDINRVQYEIIKLLSLPENNLFIVGDDDQSIYGFRGARPEMMFQFQKDYPEAREMMLNVNYRSTTEIIELAGNLITHNNNRFQKEICSAKGSGVVPDIRKFKNQGEELKFMCAQIKRHIKNGISPSEIAILVRNNSQITGVEDYLKNEMLITGHGKGADSLYRGMVARDIMAYVKAALCPADVSLRDNVDLLYIINKPSRLIGREAMVEYGDSFERLKQAYHHNRQILQNISQLEFHLKMIAGLNPYAAMVYIRNGAGYEKYLRQYAGEHRVNLLGLIKQLDRIQNDAANFDTLADWIEYAEGTGNSTKQSAVEKGKGTGIQIMTMHASKGLEFKVVYIIDANQGIIPSARIIREKDFREERRVFYVAMTRASELLNIYCVAESLGCPMEASVFIEEMMGYTDKR